MHIKDYTDLPVAMDIQCFPSGGAAIPCNTDITHSSMIWFSQRNVRGRDTLLSTQKLEELFCGSTFREWHIADRVCFFSLNSSIKRHTKAVSTDPKHDPEWSHGLSEASTYCEWKISSVSWQYCLLSWDNVTDKSWSWALQLMPLPQCGRHG